MAEARTGMDLTPERVFREHAPRIYHLARRMLGNDADAEDVTQDVLLQVVRKLDTFRGEAALPTWLHRVTVNAALAHRRRRAVREEGRILDPLEHFDTDGLHRGPVNRWRLRPEQLALDAEQKQLIEQGIARLPELYRDVFVLADVEQLPNAEIADMLGLGLPAVKSRLHRAIDDARSLVAALRGAIHMRPTCREVAELLVDFVEGELPEMQMQTLQGHICACPPCLYYLETYQTVIEATHALPEEPLPPEFEARLRLVLDQWQAEQARDCDKE